ncbi:undecaprenyldiphospho-muramoylpentapeptide beta-N-acetylglucosaminyltransferase [Salinisphaera sp. Q1T1-3]|uniref:undecaprenyldiphospho-muramoylpentapeptide beta-N-acetylglucosaminyltransferase n=1 Tax=Salinisphaera sp. Q1T1-3 TaxID=2321229 RepID=UPI000E724D19|nr:undecaprenyldiphospho-muramoylpentapeptide beta-N-acetylglucosaminyltransferase [Salinisphaera sp. Q1T1-3]RJS92224.1 undecaprenyldiphospho-muramoylpentapeptide beta-N-acetylglucosaminyltransferase [Salinisphaera sp. Q1T1-3]
MSADLDGLRVLMMAGGTGGHVFPALAVARALGTRGAIVEWLGTAAGIEARLVPAEGITLHTIRVAGLRGKHLTTLLAAPMAITRALWEARGVLRRVRPHVVVGMGGFAAGPGGVMARLGGMPLVIHEQNAAAGLTNRILARLARRTLQAFPGTFAARHGAVTVGNPVRAEILALAPPATRWAERHGPLRLLVLGGSGGALAINQRVPEALAGLADAERPQVWHQAGKTLEAAETAYAERGVAGRVEAFIDDMAAAYAWADVVICRSGALTVAELAAAGVGALLVPYPHAVDDHQAANGAYLVDAGAARLVRQNEFTADRLREELVALGGDRPALLTRAEAARAAAWPESTDRIVEACIQAREAT